MTLIDVRDVRVQLAGKDSQIEVRLGSQEPGPRLKVALDALDLFISRHRAAHRLLMLISNRLGW